MNIYILMFFVILSLFPVLSFSSLYQEPRSLALNENIKEINFNPNAVHKYTGFYGLQSSIVFERGEIVDTISIGNSNGWQINTISNRIFIKPMQDSSITNATIITNLRVYHFILYPEEADNVNDPRVSYELRFRYPENRFDINLSESDLEFDEVGSKDKESSNSTEDDIEKSDLNYEYTVYGSDRIKPSKVFDDGIFTYMLFSDPNIEIPAIFIVESDGYESLINFRVKGDYLVIESVSSLYTLRNGSDTVCVSNNRMNSDFKIKKKSKSFFKF